MIRIAAFFYQQQAHAGLVADDLQSVQPFDLPAAQGALGALPIVELLSAGSALPPLLAALPLSAVTLRAPLPQPRDALNNRTPIGVAAG